MTNKTKEKEYEAGLDFLYERSLKDYISDLEKEIIKSSLEKTTNMVEAAKLLKISKQLLKYKVEKYEL